MESTGSLEKRRGRSKKIAEALRNGLLAEPTSSPSSSVGEGLDLFPDSPLPPASGFQLSSDFRYVIHSVGFLTFSFNRELNIINDEFISENFYTRDATLIFFFF